MPWSASSVASWASVDGPYVFPPGDGSIGDDQFGGPDTTNDHLMGVILRLNPDGTTPREIMTATLNGSGVRKAAVLLVRGPSEPPVTTTTDPTPTRLRAGTPGPAPTRCSSAASTTSSCVRTPTRPCRPT